MAIPKRFSMPMREIWNIQSRFDVRNSSRARRLMTHPRFRAGYDFLLLRAQSGDAALTESATWWTEAQKGGDLPPVQADHVDGEEAPEGAEPADGPKRRRRRRRGGRRGGGGGGGAEAAPAG